MHLNKLDGVLPQPARVHKQTAKKLSAIGPAQRFLSAFTAISPYCRPTVIGFASMPIAAVADRFSTWNEVTGVTAAD